MLSISGDKLIELIPQKPPFVLISTLQEVSDETCTTTFRLSPEHVLCDDGKLNSSGLMENIAQTCAAKMGYECLLQNKKVPLGFIGDVRDFKFSQLPVAGEEITTRIVIENIIFGVTIISGKIKLGEQIIASCTMKIFVEPESKSEGQAL